MDRRQRNFCLAIRQFFIQKLGMQLVRFGLSNRLVAQSNCRHFFWCMEPKTVWFPPCKVVAFLQCCSHDQMPASFNLGWVDGASHGGPLFDAEVPVAINFLSHKLPSPVVAPQCTHQGKGLRF